MAERVMLGLGEFRFEIATAAYQKLSLSQSYRWPEQARINRDPALQFVGRNTGEIDLDGVFRDELALTEPMHPLCRPDCRGLCVECGGRLEEGEHAHGGEEIDPRLTALASLLTERNGDGRD